MMPTMLKIPKHIWRAISVLLLEDAICQNTVVADSLIEKQSISEVQRGV